MRKILRLVVAKITYEILQVYRLHPEHDYFQLFMTLLQLLESIEQY